VLFLIQNIQIDQLPWLCDHLNEPAKK